MPQTLIYRCDVSVFKANLDCHRDHNLELQCEYGTTIILASKWNPHRRCYGFYGFTAMVIFGIKMNLHLQDLVSSGRSHWNSMNQSQLFQVWRTNDDIYNATATMKESVKMAKEIIEVHSKKRNKPHASIHREYWRLCFSHRKLYWNY